MSEDSSSSKKSRRIRAGRSLDEDESGGRPFTLDDAQRLERLEDMMVKLMNNRGGGGGGKMATGNSTPNPYLVDATPRPSMTPKIKNGPDVISIDPDVTPPRLRTRPDSVDSIPSSEIEKRRLSMGDEGRHEHFNVTKLDGLAAEIVNENGAWMIDPRRAPRMFWDICLLMPFLIYLLFSMPFRICFQNDPVCYTGIYWFELCIEVAFIVDIGFNFRTGFVVEGLTDKEDDRVEFDRLRVIQSYLSSWFALDVVSGIPFMVIELVMGACGSGGEDGAASNLKSLKVLRLLRFAKLGRLLKIGKILSTLDRDVLDRIEDVMCDNNTRTFILLSALAFKMGFLCHILACIWVFIGRLGDAQGKSNWLAHEVCDDEMECDWGPFTKEDTTGGPHVGTIYLSAYYYSLATVTSVGFGDVITRNDNERIFVSVVMFMSAAILGVIIASLTSVVTSMDMDARMTAEKLDEVGSFVHRNKFPEWLGRRIRRHFRQFYARKSAINETKIFNDLGTTLRSIVSEYLLQDTMSNVRLFNRMSKTLWPRLLPLLRPVFFDWDHGKPETHVMCTQGDDVTEMFVILSGAFKGVTALEDDVKSRRIVTGNTINSLGALGVWHEAIETVSVESPSETYALNFGDFKDLFKTPGDKTDFQEMQKEEVKRFKMVTGEAAEDAPTGLGRPLYISCFSTLSIRVAKARDLIGTVRDTPDAFAITEVIWQESGIPLDKHYILQSDVVRSTKNPIWNHTFDCADISAPFDRLAVRVRIFDGYGLSEVRFLGMVVMKLTDCEDAGDEIDENEDAKDEDFDPAWRELQSDQFGKAQGSVHIIAKAQRAEGNF